MDGGVYCVLSRLKNADGPLAGEHTVSRFVLPFHILKQVKGTQSTWHLPLASVYVGFVILVCARSLQISAHHETTLILHREARFL
jgi:hypothetical protein